MPTPRNPHLSSEIMGTISRHFTLQGEWLLKQQPMRALPALHAMQQCLDHAAGGVRQSLTTLLASLTPGLPLLQAPTQVRHAAPPTLEHYWLLDPIDGAVQYLSGLPLWTLSLCLVSQSRPSWALIHEPARGVLWQALAGQGAWRDGQRLQCQDRRPQSLAVLGTSFPNYPPRPQTELSAFMATLARAVPRVFAQRWMGPASLSLAQLGAGQLDGYWELGGSCYDWLAGALLAEEAGARLTDLNGGPLTWASTSLLAASPALHAELAETLA